MLRGWLLLLIFISGSLQAWEECNPCLDFERDFLGLWKPERELTWGDYSLPCAGNNWVSLGYRQDIFEWSVAGRSGSPNILAEFDWDRLRMLVASIYGWNTDCLGIYYRYAADYASVLHGEYRESRFADDDRVREFKRVKAKASDGNMYDISGAVGYLFSFCNRGLLLAPIFGMSVHEQHLHKHSPRPECRFENLPPLRRYHGLRTDYTARWWGPWLGLDATWQACCDWVFTGKIEYHHASYRGRGNFRRHGRGSSSDCDEWFHHKAHGHGTVGELGAHFAFRWGWLFNATVGLQHWKTKQGVDYHRRYFTVRDAFGIPLAVNKVRVSQPFNGADWWSFNVLGSIEYRY